jgi:hypothetical protein
MRLGNKIFGEGSGGVDASLTIRGLSDRFRLEVPTVLITNAQGRIRVWATYGTCERIAAGGSVMWQIGRGGSPNEKAVPEGKGSPDLDSISERERARV